MYRVRSSLWSAAATLILVVAGCNDEAPNISGIDPISIARVEITPRLDTIFVADSAFESDIAQLQATVFLHSGLARTDVPLVWETSDSSVAVVDEDGTVFPTGYGTTRVFASAGDQAEATIVVAPPATGAVLIAPVLDTLVVGDSVQLQAAVIDVNQSFVPGFVYEFSTSDPGIVGVSGTGLVKALNPGTAIVTVAAAGHTAQAQIVVIPRDITPLSTSVPGALSGILSAGVDVTCGLLLGGRGYCFGVEPVIGIARDTICFDDVPPDEPSGRTFGCTLLPLPIAGGLTLRSISAGSTVACGVTESSQAYCWGSNDLGQLGTGGVIGGSSETPALVTSALSFTQVTAGGQHACGVAAGGTVYCWGADSAGQLGDARRVHSTTPIPVRGALTFSAVTAGAQHSCGLTTDGAAYCWGNNSSGQLGNNTGSARDTVPIPVAGGRQFTALTAGGAHTCGLEAGSGAAYCWGSDEFGQLGRAGGTGTAAQPVPVAGGLTFQAISTGTLHTCGVTAGGSAFCWGINDYGQLGNGNGELAPAAQQNAPTPVLGGLTFATIAAGRRHTCAVAADGTYCWGSNILGALGNGLQAAVRATPQKVGPFQ